MGRHSRIVINHDAVEHLLKVNAVPLLEQVGQKILAAAPDGCEMQTFVGATRARVTIRTATTEARIAEATNRSLTRAFEAGRS